ncbi:hypothetical protein DP42_5690 [Burkholderia pseudomallei]|nr:hypothetical protein DO73_5744 [Burkholderia pseudomallei]KGD27344.1 hypothetical protein DP42_5690 [Burkholderia pseudomallei]
MNVSPRASSTSSTVFHAWGAPRPATHARPVSLAYSSIASANARRSISTLDGVLSSRRAIGRANCERNAEDVAVAVLDRLNPTARSDAQWITLSSGSRDVPARTRCRCGDTSNRRMPPACGTASVIVPAMVRCRPRLDVVAPTSYASIVLRRTSPREAAIIRMLMRSMRVASGCTNGSTNAGVSISVQCSRRPWSSGSSASSR